MTGGAVALAVVAGVAVVGAGRARADDPADATLAGWPATTRAVLAPRGAQIYERAAPSNKIGRLAPGARVGVRGIVRGRGCRAWVGLAPRGWVCAAVLVPSDAPPDDADAPAPPITGLDRDPPGWPFAWLYAPAPGAELIARAAPAADAAIVRRYADRATVPVIEERGAWLRIARDAWLPRAQARIARRAARPAGVGPTARWLDVDLDQQTLTAWVGDRPVFATLVSTAGRGAITPTGVYRIILKAARRDLDGPPGNHWVQAGVPWVMSYRTWYAVHGATWHADFGTPVSHGCINVAPGDGRWLFDWAPPQVPAGWDQVEAAPGEGTAIRVHDAAHPDPPWRDYDGRALAPSI